MEKRTFLIAIALSIVTGVVYAAGSDAFRILPVHIANFAGLVCGAIAGIAWIVYGVQSKEAREKDKSRDK